MSTWEQARMDEEAKRQAGMTFEEWQATYNADDPDPRVEALARILYEHEAGHGEDSWPPEERPQFVQEAYRNDAETWIADLDQADTDHVRVPVKELEHLLGFIPEEARAARAVCEWFIKGRPDPLADDQT